MVAEDLHSVLRARAIRLLARREYSRAELRHTLVRRLASVAANGLERQGHDDEAIPSALVDDVLDQLEASGLLSDARAADSYVRSHAPRLGRAMLDYRLRQRGIADHLIAASLNQEDLADETSRALAVWRSRFGTLPTDAREWARQARFLQGRGFASPLIRQLLAGRLPHEE